MMTLIQIVIVLAVLGVIVYLIETYLPLAYPFKLAIRLVVLVGLLLWLARLASLWGVA